MAQTRTVQVGDTLGGHFRIDGLVAEGGMGIVYRGTNLGTGKACAIKVILPHLADRSGVLDRFQQEAQIGATIGESPHIVSVLFASVDAERRVPYFVMELLVGESVEALIAQPLEATQVCTLVEQLAEALDQAHERGVVHRDLKPSNLYVTRDRKQRPVLKVLDFGIAKLLEGAGTATELGTPAYAAPEQLGPLFRRMALKSGIEIADHVTPQTDLWAMGLITYEMLVGGKPGQYWDATTAQEIGAAMTMALTSRAPASERAGDRARLLPGGFDGWFLRCLEMDARKRWSSAGEAAAALAALTTGANTLRAPEPGRPKGEIGVAGVVGTSLDHLADFSPQAPAVLAATPAPTRPRRKSEGPETQLGAAIPTYLPETRPSPPPSPPSPRAGSRGKLGAAVVGTLVAIGVVGGVLGRSRPPSDASVAPSSTGSSMPSPPVASVPSSELAKVAWASSSSGAPHSGTDSGVSAIGALDGGDDAARSTNLVATVHAPATVPSAAARGVAPKEPVRVKTPEEQAAAAEVRMIAVCKGNLPYLTTDQERNLKMLEMSGRPELEAKAAEVRDTMTEQKRTKCDQLRAAGKL